MSENRKKRLLCLLLSFMMVCALVTPPALAAETEEAGAGVTETELKAVSIDVQAVSLAASNTVVLNSADGATQSDIQSALNSASSGDVIQISGSFTLTSALKLRRNGVTLDATGATITAGSGATLLLDLYQVSSCTVKGGTWNAASIQAVKLSGCTGCTLSGMTIKKGKNSNGTILVYNSGSTTVSGCTLTSAGDQALYASKSDDFVAVGNTVSGANGYGIHTYYCDDPVIIGNTVKNCCGDGIYSSNSDGGSMSGNTISGITANSKLDIDSSTGVARSGCGIFLSYCEDYDVGVSVKYSGKTYTGNSVSTVDNYGIALNLSDSTYIYKLTTNKTGNNSIHVSASNYTVVSTCTVTNSYAGGIVTTPGTVSSTCQNSVVVDNTISTCANYGIWVNKSNNTKIAGNTIKGTKGDAIHCSNSATNVKISGNTISNTASTSASGIGVYGCTGTTIGGSLTINGTTYQKNTISNSKQYGVLVSASDSTSVRYCVISSAANPSIRLTKSKSCTVSNNTIKNGSSYGIYLSGASTVSNMKSNTISGCSSYGISVTDSSVVTTMSGNKISGSSSGGISVRSSKVTTISSNTVTSTANFGIYLKDITANCSVKSNTISGYQCPVRVDCSTSRTVTISSNKLTGKTSAYCLVVAAGKISVSGNTFSSGKAPVYTASGVQGGIGVNSVSSCTSNKYVIKGSTNYSVTAPAKTSSLTVKKAASGKMTVTWAQVSNASGYQIQYSTSSDMSNSTTVKVSGGSTLTKTISGLTAGKTYYVRIRAYRTCNNISVYGAFCSAKSVKV